MAGSVTVTYSAHALNQGGRLKVVNVAWTADAADGSVPDTTLSNLKGRLLKAITNPGATAPTDNYDLKLLDNLDSTADALDGLLDNRDTANTEVELPAAPPILSGDYTFNLTNNSVNSATGVLILLIEE